MLTKREIEAIRFYQGDVRKRIEHASFSESEKEAGFFGIPSAYKTMNCLMFDGIENERERIDEGTASLNPQVFLEVEKVIDVFCDIYRAMCKRIALEVNPKGIQKLYRTDRGISVREMRKQGKTISFTSTSKENHPKEYFRKKRELTLLEIILLPGIPYLDFEDVFGSNYRFADQKEVLLPPFVHASFYEGTLTKEEKEYRDADGLAPQCKYIVVLEGVVLPEPGEAIQESKDELSELIGNKEQMADLLKKMIRKETLTETKEYCSWKKLFREIIIKEFQDIQKECKGIEDCIQYKRAQIQLQIDNESEVFQNDIIS